MNKIQPGHCIARDKKVEKVQIADIITLWESGSTAKEIASIFKISERHVRRLVEEAGYEKEGRRSKYNKDIEEAIEALKENPMIQLHKVVKDKNLRRAVKARWDKIKKLYIEQYLEKTGTEIEKIKDLIQKNPDLSFKDLGYDEEDIKALEKNEKFQEIIQARKNALCDRWIGLYLLRGKNIFKLIEKGKIEPTGSHLKHLNDDKEFDISKIEVDNDLGVTKKRTKKGGDYSKCRVIELMK